MTPFKHDPSKYLEKILNLLTIINEVDSNNNLAELKNEYEKTKTQLDKERTEKRKSMNEVNQLTHQSDELIQANKVLHMEIN
jgi:DNA repair exonuclease SbcCD ATPase subunit